MGTEPPSTTDATPSPARDELLQRWVKQPPVGPLVQCLRDLEHDAALRALGPRARVLDLASEASVTERLDADEVVRVDFSPAASERAREVLGDRVSDYRVADPEAPALPFDDRAFDGVVCVGPYDWRFLDVDALTRETRRVTAADGAFVVTVPTPRSPYARDGSNRSYSPAAFRRLVSPDWRLVDHELVFQYPARVHDALTSAPWAVQEPFVDLAGRLSEELTARDVWSRASYLAAGLRPMHHDHALDSGLEALFRPLDEHGFWDEAEGRFGRGLLYELVGDRVEWSVDETNEWRYAPFGLMGAMRWRASSLGDDRYDDEFYAALDAFERAVRDPATLAAIPSYGVGPLLAGFAVAADVFSDDRDRLLEVARLLADDAQERFDYANSEDSLVLYGLTFLYEATGDDSLRRAIRDALFGIVERQSQEGLFRFDNPTTRRHQNQMYTLWGVARAAEVTDLSGYLGSVERVLDYTIEHRMRDDGAFIWEDRPPHKRAYDTLRSRVRGGTPYWHYLYECHQTFFVNAVAHYYAAGGTRNYDDAVRRAMAWIYGENDLGRDLVDVAGIGVPMRQLTTDGRMDHRHFVAGGRSQLYKGTYEVGSYVMALTHLLDGTIGSATP